MPKLLSAAPKYAKHRATGQAVVRLDGRDFYLGPHGSKTSKLEYDRLIGEWLANGRRLPSASVADLTVSEVLVRYWAFAEQHYRKDGATTGEIDNIRYAARPLRKLYGNTPAADFGPLALKTLQGQMIDADLSRGVINSRISRIKRIFKWAASEQLVPPSIFHGLLTVAGLEGGRTRAREAEPVGPVEDAVVTATLKHLPQVLQDMVQLQRLLGCRPGEICSMRPADIDRSSDVWMYRPARHKTQHHGRDRRIAVGPRAQAILTRYLLRASDAYCFSPAESERQRKEALRAQRKTKVQPSQLNRGKAAPKRKPRERYVKDSYCRAIQRGCEAAFPAPPKATPEQAKRWNREHRWSPNQLRHSMATAVRKQYGLDGVQVVLGHAKADVSQIYAERDYSLAARIAREVG